MSHKDLIKINNEKSFIENEAFYCDNLDLKVLPEELNNYNQVQYIVRSSKKKSYQKINLRNIKIGSNFLQFIYFVMKTLKIPQANYLIISITPYTFFSFLLLFIFNKKKRTFLYLFSSGHEEYKYILGRYFVWIYKNRLFLPKTTFIGKTGLRNCSRPYCYKNIGETSS